MNFKPAASYPEVTGHPGWIRKMRTVFRRLDSNGHGYVCVSDFLDIASRILTTFSKCDHFFEDQVVQNMVHLWYGVICTIGEEHTRTNAQLNEAMFVDSMRKCINAAFKEEFKSIMVDTFFDLADTDHDGLIQMNEFEGIIEAWRGNPKEAELVFRLVDSAGDKKGKITKEQYEGVIAEYFFDEDIKGKTAKLWGALINYKRPEDYPECECGPTWEGKMRTMFRRLDINQAGKLRCHDFIQIGRSLAQRNHLVKHKADALMRSMLDIWVHYFSVDKDAFEKGETANHFTELTEKQFIHNLRSMINGDFRHQIDQFGWTFFKAVDIEGTGYISMTEYRNLQEAWRVGRGEAEGMFKVLDTDKDGKISSDEYLSAWVEYFLGEDNNSPYKTFFGPVIFKPAQGQ
uniref:Sarcoplasmic calcium-binding protein n=1 Tax=Schistocephalus solidus TaxID=70667 RepID=A0A0X3NXZ0_SCHSO